MIRILYRHASGTLVRDFPQEQLSAAVREGNATLWVDMQTPTEAEYQDVLQTVFNFHPLAIEDAANSILVPKINDYRRYLFLVIHSVYYGSEPVDLTSSEMDIFLGPNFLVTIHEREMNSIDELWQDEGFHKSEGLAQGPAMLLYEILDRQVDRFMRLLDQFEMELERLGDVIFQRDGGSQDGLLDDILTAKSSALRLSRVLNPQRDLMHRLANNEYSVIPAGARPYFADIYDHMVRMAGLVDGMQALVNSTVDIYLALANNRMNEIVKVLTIVTSIFIPLSFLAGVYGMNFTHMPELAWRWGYLLLWAVFIAIAATLLRYFRKWKWL
ncbi:MAG: magnesium/cobalt transporter CorA [Caldilineaceae bacterium]|nr:magnesium/cobalt transporter CorA [Caldilineaceae bacterium]